MFPHAHFCRLLICYVDKPRESIPIEVDFVAIIIFFRSKCDLNWLLLQWKQGAHCDKFRYICAIQWHKEDSAPLPLCKYTIRSLSAIMKLSSALQHSYTEHCAACSDQTQTARVYQNADSSPSKHDDSTQCCFNVGPAPLAVGQYWNSIGSNTRVCWDPHRCLSTRTPPPP